MHEILGKAKCKANDALFGSVKDGGCLDYLSDY
jgi:hypothetical protein